MSAFIQPHGDTAARATSAFPAASKDLSAPTSMGTPVMAVMRKNPPNMYAKGPNTLTQNTVNANASDFQLPGTYLRKNSTILSVCGEIATLRPMRAGRKKF